MEAKKIIQGVGAVMAVVILIAFAALVVGTILNLSVFSSITIINITALSESFGDFVTGLIVFLGLVGTIIGIVWAVGYIRELFDKKKGLSNIGA